MAALGWSVPLFVEDRMVGTAYVQLGENGALTINAGSTEDPKIYIEDLPHMSGYSLVLQSIKNSTPKHDCSPNYCCCGPEDIKPLPLHQVAGQKYDPAIDDEVRDGPKQ